MTKRWHSVLAVFVGLWLGPAAGGTRAGFVTTVVMSGLDNPRGLAFGPNGDFLTSSRAPLDLSTLAPGDESPFVISVPIEGEVSRYRIGFRTEAGAVVAHVDRRTPDALASRQGEP